MHRKSLTTPIVGLVILFVLVGILFVYDVSIVEAATQFGDKLYFLRQQVMWSIVGLMGMLVAAKIPTRFWFKMAPFFFSFSFVLLLAVLIPHIGTSVGGARRWIRLAGFTIQPSELMKLALTMYLSVWLSKSRRFLSFLLLVAGIFITVLIEPDLGTALILAITAGSMYFLSGKPIRHFIWLFATALFSLLIIIVVAPYRLDRLKTYLDPESDPLGRSYHIHQITLALGNGGLFGRGLGKSLQKYRYIPEATTDSIFAVIAEEIGFLGCGIIIIGYITLFRRMSEFVSNLDGAQEILLGGGIVAWICAQTIVNLGSVFALIPLTGVPLPFISYGGSALATELFGIGILLGLKNEKRIYNGRAPDSRARRHR
ncbi:MAG TPA: putative peptidoglycan glycosyltransferase FtsW [Patescibacteria group bacterium]|nr:putative peptidoglycan glycosyltransferase FtsW [Patescibacteria group bacterium]